MQTPYQQAFAGWSPVFKAKFRDASRVVCHHAKQDVLETIGLHSDESESAYVGKLYAELDAIRDRELVLNRSKQPEVA